MFLGKLDQNSGAHGNISSFYIRNFKPLASLCGCVGRFESYLVEIPEDRFSRDEPHFVPGRLFCIHAICNHTCICASGEGNVCMPIREEIGVVAVPLVF